jgi:hypothetical protein
MTVSANADLLLVCKCVDFIPAQKRVVISEAAPLSEIDNGLIIKLIRKFLEKYAIRETRRG